MDLLKIRNVKDANRGTAKSAGIDFYMPELTDEFLYDLFQKNKKFFYSLVLDNLEVSQMELLASLEQDSKKNLPDILGILMQVLIHNNGQVSIEVQSGSDLCIPTGYRTRFDSGAFIAFNKSGVATKLKFVMGACVDDLDYQGELHMHVMNVSSKSSKVTFGNKLTQFIHVPVDLSIPVIRSGISAEEFFGTQSERGEGGFGSTSVK